MFTSTPLCCMGILRLSNYLVLPLVKLLGIGLGFSYEAPGHGFTVTLATWRMAMQHFSRGLKKLEIWDEKDPR